MRNIAITLKLDRCILELTLNTPSKKYNFEFGWLVLDERVVKKNHKLLIRVRDKRVTPDERSSSGFAPVKCNNHENT